MVPTSNGLETKGLPSKMDPLKHGFRQVHLDFHTNPLIPGVGSKFDAKAFARTAKNAHVDSVTVFAKCHHGHLYFDTKHPSRHPTLPKGFNLLRAQIDALHAEGIRAPIYVSVELDEFAANAHPEWLALNPNGSPVGFGPLEAGWRFLDLASPYLDYMQDQLAEVLDMFPSADGFFFDIMIDQPSVSKWAKERMARWGLDPTLERDRSRYGYRIVLHAMDSISRQVKAACPKATVYFNSRPFHYLPSDVKYLTHIEIESLPSGSWGYTYFPLNIRYARTFGKPCLGMTARFHKGWADFGGLKHKAALKYEVSQMISHGARCSIGDQMNPVGTLDKAAWDLIGHAYAHVEASQPWCEDAKQVTQIALFRTPVEQATVLDPMSKPDAGAVRMLTQLRHQFDVVSYETDLKDYQLLILPDRIPVDTKYALKLTGFLKEGGTILATGTSGLDAMLKRILPSLPVVQATLSPFTTTYVRYNKKLFPDLPATDHVNYVPTLRVKGMKSAKILARIVEPYFERSHEHFCSHFQTPAAKLTKWPAALQRGSVGYIPFPVFSAYAEHGNLHYKKLVDGCIQQLIGRPMLETNAPSYAETSVMRQGKSTVVHFLAYCPERRAEGLDIIEDEVPLYNTTLSLALSEKPRKAYLAPSRKEIDFTYADGRVEAVVPEIEGHQMVVFE